MQSTRLGVRSNGATPPPDQNTPRSRFSRLPATTGQHQRALARDYYNVSSLRSWRCLLSGAAAADNTAHNGAGGGRGSARAVRLGDDSNAQAAQHNSLGPRGDGGTRTTRWTCVRYERSQLLRTAGRAGGVGGTATLALVLQLGRARGARGACRMGLSCRGVCLCRRAGHVTLESAPVSQPSPFNFHLSRRTQSTAPN
jgi:hypothetical protein